MWCRSTVLIVAASCVVLVASGCSGEPEPDPVPELEVRTLADLGPQHGAEAVVVDGKAVVTAGSSPDRTLWVYDIDSGEELWAIDSFAVNDVWVDGDKVVFTESIDDKNVVSVRDLASGDETRQIELAPDSPAGQESRLAGAGSGTAFIVQQVEDDVDERLEAVELESGDVRWRHNPEGRGDLRGVYSPEAVPQHGIAGDGGMATIHIAGDAPIVQVADTKELDGTWMLDVTTGEPMWSLSAPGELTWQTWDLGGNLVASIPGERTDECGRTVSYSDLEAHRATDIDAYRSTYLDSDWGCGENNGWSTPITADGIMAQDSENHPQVTGWDGTPLWTADKTGEPITQGSGVAVYRQLPTDGRALAVDMKTNKELWSLDEFGNGLVPTLVGDSLIISHEGMKAVDLRDGTPQWYYPDGYLIATDGRWALFDAGSDESTTLTVARIDAVE